MLSSSSNGANLALELEAARDLLECLNIEQINLVRADAQAVARNTEEKNVILAQMNALAENRMNTVVDAGYSADEAGMQAWLRAQDISVRTAWQHLLTLATAGREINRTNGILIQQHLMRIRTGLQVLQGNNQPVVYGRNGQQQIGRIKRSLVTG